MGETSRGNQRGTVGTVGGPAEQNAGAMPAFEPWPSVLFDEGIGAVRVFAHS